MSVIKKGNSLTTPVASKGYAVNNDGFGLLTSQVTLVGDVSSAIPKKGDAHPAVSFMKAWKVSEEYQSTERRIFKVDYVGIGSSGGAGSTNVYVESDRTSPNVSGAIGLQTESIQNHPQFFDGTVPTGGDPAMYMVAGHGTGTAAAPVFAPSTIVAGEYVGYHGAHFTTSNGVKFTGFKDPYYQAHYGKGNYLAAVTSLSGIIYIKSSTECQVLMRNVGKSFKDNTWIVTGTSGIPILPDFIGTDWEGTWGNRLLFAGVNFEEYGHVYKCSYTVRVNWTGWPTDVYPAIS